jgi:hypothetical protein
MLGICGVRVTMSMVTLPTTTMGLGVVVNAATCSFGRI